MPTVLVISRYFPPSGSPGASIRLTKLIKYASQREWDFIILTQHPDYLVRTEGKGASALLDELPENIKIHYIPNPLLHNPFYRRIFRSRLLFFADLPSFFWMGAVLSRGFSILMHDRVDLIFSNSPPFSNVLIGEILSRLCGKPFVIDMKDDWIGAAHYQSKGWVAHFIQRRIEHFVFKHAQSIFVPTDLSLANYRFRYSTAFRSAKFQLMPNGFDDSEHNIIEAEADAGNPNHFVLLTAALGYRPDYRDLTPLIQSLKLFVEHNPQIVDKLRVVFLGEKIHEVYLRQFEAAGLINQVVFYENLKRPDFIRLLRIANLYFLVQPNGNTTAISGTLFEYWAAGKAPILLISERGASSQLVEENSLGRHFLFDQKSQISQYLQFVYDFRCSGKPWVINREGLSFFSRELIAKKMLQNFIDVLDPTKEKEA